MRLQHGAAICCVAALCAVLSAASAPAAGRGLTGGEASALVETFAQAGYGRAFLRTVFRDPRVRYVPNLVRLLVIPPDFSANYARFTTQAEIRRARAFRRLWRTRLERTGEAYGVDPDVIVAILLVETGLGENLGSSPVLSVYASLLLESTLHRETFTGQLAGNPRRDHYMRRLDDKAAWARGELEALLAMRRNNAVDVCGLRGSYAGAFGIVQFLPTSYLKWAGSGEDKRSPDLFYMPHAIISAANFLKAHGWRPGLNAEEQHAVIRHYNRSSVYAGTVLAVAAHLNKNPHHR